MFKNREMSRLDLDVDCGVEIDELQQGAFDSDKVRVLFNQLEFRTLLPRLLEAIGEVAEVPEADVLEVDVVTARDAQAAEAALLKAAEHARVAIEPRWSGAAGRSPLVGLAIATDESVTYLDAALVAEGAAHIALGALVGGEFPARRAPLEGIDPRLGRRVRGRRARHRGDGVPPRSR